MFKRTFIISSLVITLFSIGTHSAYSSPLGYAANYLFPEKATSHLNTLIKCHRDRVIKRSGGKEGLQNALESVEEIRLHLDDEVILEGAVQDCQDKLASLPADE